MKKYTKEIELIDDYCKFLDSQGCEYKREVRKGSYHNDGYFDVLIKKNDLFIAVEAKLNSFQSVRSQASRNLVLCDLSYILYPRKPSFSNLKKCKGEDWTIGVIIPSGNSFLYLIKSRQYFKYWGSKVERNWNENRSGRIIHNSEIPEGYNKQKIEDLKCKYEWTNQPGEDRD